MTRQDLSDSILEDKSVEGSEWGISLLIIIYFGRMTRCENGIWGIERCAAHSILDTLSFYTSCLYYKWSPLYRACIAQWWTGISARRRRRRSGWPQGSGLPRAPICCIFCVFGLKMWKLPSDAPWECECVISWLTSRALFNCFKICDDSDKMRCSVCTLTRSD